MAKWRKDTSGAAMVVAIVIVVVLMLLSTTLLTASYSLYRSAVRVQTADECREMAYSLSLELEQEITAPSYDSFEAMVAAVEAGEAPLWSYLRCNVGQDNWPCAAEETGHDASRSRRTFTLNADALSEVGFDIQVTLWWEYGEETNDGQTVLLYVMVTSGKMDRSCSVTAVYELERTQDAAGYGPVGDTTPYWPYSPSNPNQNGIINEQWTFRLCRRDQGAA